jgi:cell division transport system ATP-binding protein
MLSFQNVTKRYANGHEALRDVSLDISAGELIFLTGHSGAGKSTLLKLIPILERPTSGNIIMDGANIVRMKKHYIPLLRRNIGMVFQDHHLLSDRSVLSNVMLPLEVSGMDRRECRKRAQAALDKVGLLNKQDRQPITLSTGEQQRVGIARAVVNRPPILLADEPTGNLDPKLSREIMSLLAEFNAVGVTAIIATHDIQLAKQMQRRMVMLHQGKLMEAGIPTVRT